MARSSTAAGVGVSTCDERSPFTLDEVENGPHELDVVRMFIRMPRQLETAKGGAQPRGGRPSEEDPQQLA